MPPTVGSSDIHDKTVLTRHLAAGVIPSAGAATAGASSAAGGTAATGSSGTDATGSSGTDATGSSGTDATGSSAASISVGGTTAQDGAATTSSASASPFEKFLAPAAPDTAGVHARFEDDEGPVNACTSPVIARGLTADFEAQWAAPPGGNLTATGFKDRFGAVIPPFTIASNPGGQTKCLQIIFDASAGVISFAGGAGGAGHGCTLGFGKRIGLAALPAAPVGFGACDAAGTDISYTPETVTVNAVYGSVEFTTGPNGAKNFVVFTPAVAHTHVAPLHDHDVGDITATDAGHTHTGPAHTHTGPAHTHTGSSHTHTGPSHTHVQT